MKIRKVADVIDGVIVQSDNQLYEAFCRQITCVEGSANPNTGVAWKLEMTIGEGLHARPVQLELPPLVENSQSLERPIYFGSFPIAFFRDHFFMPERAARNAAELEEIDLRVRKHVYDADAELLALRSAVSNLEAASQFQRSGPRRDPIPEDVKLVVWARDGGACIRCGSKESLHFDHVIPVSKGGSNEAVNVQILCQTCNLKKSDKIAF